jgi:hypothetical protein
MVHTEGIGVLLPKLHDEIARLYVVFGALSSPHKMWCSLQREYCTKMLGKFTIAGCLRVQGVEDNPAAIAGVCRMEL